MAIVTNSSIFIHIPKTAGSSITKRLNGKKYEDTHSHASLIRDKYEPDFRNKFVFSIIRNPWDRLYSMYKFRTQRDGRKVRFKDWFFQDLNDTKIESSQTPKGESIISNLKKPQVRWLQDPKTGLIIVDYIGLFEKLNESLDVIERNTGHKIKPLPYTQQTSNERHYRDIYDNELKELVAEYFKEDIEYGQYNF